MPFPKVDAKKRLIPNLKDVTHYRVEQEVRRLWTSVFQVQDASQDVADMTLTKNTLLDRPLVAGKSVIFILRQDVTGGWTWTWAKNPDGSTKFKGTALMTPLVLTANTYTKAIFYATSPTEAVLSTWLTGGSLG